MSVKRTRAVFVVPLSEGATDELNRLLGEDALDGTLEEEVDYCTYVDAMGHTAVPMLVAIRTRTSWAGNPPENANVPRLNPDGYFGAGA